MNESYFLVEHAVFSVNWARRAASGRNETALLKATDGASQADLDGARDWASRVEPFDGGYDPRNLFFFPTTSGSFAVGRLTPAPPEAGEGSFYFQTFFVEEDAFFQCGANPVALLHLALNTTRFSLYRPGAALEPFRLETRASWIDWPELRRTTEKIGVRALTTLIQTALDSSRSTFVSDYNAFLVVAALFELTPIDWRPELTFAVGARFRDEFSLRLVGATAKRGVEPPCVEEGTPCVDLRDVVENDDAYPIENAWAALVELALKTDRVDYLYERIAEDFFLRRNDRDADDVERGLSTDEIAELGLRWRLGLENLLRGEANDGETGERDDAAFDDAPSWEDERDDETESFFGGEFQGGWKDSDGDERWRIDESDAFEAETFERAERRESERSGPEFVLKVVDSSEPDDGADPRDREKDREENAAQDKNGKKGKNGENDKVGENGGATPNVGSDGVDVFAGESFEEEWASRLRSEKNGGNGEIDENDGEIDEFDKTLDALRRAFAEKDGFAASNGARRTAVVGNFDDFLKWLKRGRANDETLGLDALAELNAFLGEPGADALERLKRAIAERVGRDADVEPSERDVLRLRLAPFAALSAEFPRWDKELRRFDALVDDALLGGDEEVAALSDFWRRWRRELDGETIARIRGAYETRLRGRWEAGGGGAIDRTDRLLAALAVYGALFMER